MNLIWAVIEDCDRIVVSYNNIHLSKAWRTSPDKRPILAISHNIASCGMCSEVIYTPCHQITHHQFTADTATTCTWFSIEMNTLIHRCGDDVSELITVEAADMAPVGAEATS